MDVTPLASGHGIRIGSAGPLFLMVCDTMTDTRSLQLIDETEAKFVAQQPKIITMTVIAAPSLSAPDAQARDQSAQLFNKYERYLAGSAIVITTSGLSAVVARTFLAAYQLVIAHKVPQRTFRDLPSAASWCQTLLPEAASLPQLAEAVQRFVKP